MTDVETSKRDIQGFITSGFGHTYQAAYLFLRVTDLALAKAWLNDTIPQVMTAQSWRPELPRSPNDVPPAKEYPARVLNIAFSFEGLAAFNLSDAVLRSFPAELQQGIASAIRAQRMGDTGESDPSHWQVGAPSNTPFHILLILHADIEPEKNDDIQLFVNDVVQALKGLEVTHTEWGYRRHDDKEHFGFRDGISQPKIRNINFYDRQGKSLRDPVETGEFIMGYTNEYGLYPSVPVVARSEDPGDILPPFSNPRAAVQQPASYVPAVHLYRFERLRQKRDVCGLSQNAPARQRLLAVHHERNCPAGWDCFAPAHGLAGIKTGRALPGWHAACPAS
jgi:hypothetical protein